MTQRILHIWLALVAIVGSVSAQSLSVQPIEVQTGEQTEMVVSLTGATAMTALQFNLQLPAGLTATADNVTLGAATDGHTLSIQTLDGGDLLFILYSMDLNHFKDGELLRIPVTAGNSATNATGQLYTVRAASISGEDAVSHECSNVQFTATVTAPEPATEVTDAQFEAANAAIVAGEKYIITTTWNDTKYYLTSGGDLTDTETQAGAFLFQQTVGSNLFRSPGWKLDACFSNPQLSADGGASGDLLPQGHILTDKQARDDWEGQVWYLNEDGMYAVRATNANATSWGAQTYWTVLDANGDGKPEADYSWNPAFLWQLEKWVDTGINNVNINDNVNDNYYDLSGRKVVKSMKGIYVHNRKKRLVK